MAFMKSPKSSEARKGLTQLRLRKGMSGLHIGINLLFMLVGWFLINYLAVRQGFREDWSLTKPTQLAPRTESLLAGLEAPVNAILFMESSYRARDEVVDLLTEVVLRTDLIQLERVDPDRDIGRTKALQTQFNLQEPNCLILEVQGRTRMLPLDEMVVLAPASPQNPGMAAEMVGFQGEAVLGGALLSLIRDQHPVVYFLFGHGEKELDRFDAHPQAYSAVKERLERDFIDVRILKGPEEQEIPADADLVVIAGPQTRIAQPEVDMIRRYFQQKGRLMILLDTGIDSGLEPFLEDVGIQVSQDRVVEQARTLIPGTVHVTAYGSHPVTHALQGFRTIFVQPRSIRPISENGNDADRPIVTPLLTSSARSWAETQFDQQPPRYDADVDTFGPVPFGVAVEMAHGSEAAGNTRRLVVIGDSEFASNGLQSGGGIQLLQHSVNWLLDRTDLLDIPPKPVQEIRLNMTQRALNRLLLDVAVLLPLGIAALGGWVSWRRRA
jgi:hypothetical protein